MKKLISKQLSVVLGLVLLSSVSFAGPFNGIHPLQSDRFTIGLGGYWPDVSGEFSIDDPDGGDGTDIDFQDDAGLDDNETLPAFGLVWRVSNNTRIQGEYFSLDQSGTKRVDRTLHIGDREFDVGASIATDMNIDIVRAFFGYSFVKNDTTELGAGLGLHYFDLDISVAGKADIEESADISAERSIIDDWAILPNIGGYANYAFSPKWIVGGRVDWISANINDFDGTLWNVEAHVQYQIFDHFGVGLAYRYLDLELAEENRAKGDWEAELEYSGPLLFFTANF
jgi:opacity protein-like surface antigen